MNFSVSNSIGFLGGLMLFAALMIAFIVVATTIVRVVRGGNEEPADLTDRRVPDDDDVL